VTANFSVVDLYRMMRTKGFAEGLTRGLLDRSCMYGMCGSIPTQPAVRSYIRASEGRVFIIANYSQIELRIAAKISGDTEMLAAYAEGRYLHTLTAQNLTGHKDVSKDDRKLAKALNFGLLYGMGAKGLRSYALTARFRAVDLLADSQRAQRSPEHLWGQSSTGPFLSLPPKPLCSWPRPCGAGS
jgi:hypothetical protein